MLAFLALHIAALLFWIAALVYLPVLIIGRQAQKLELEESSPRYDSIARFVFTQIASPVAIVAIISGTAVFLLNRTIDPWLIAKLTLVALLVVGHCLMGLLVIRLESDRARPLRLWCTLLLVFYCLIATTITWLVLAKPAWEVSL